MSKTLRDVRAELERAGVSPTAHDCAVIDKARDILMNWSILDEIRAVACGEKQVANNDTEALQWIVETIDKAINPEWAKLGPEANLHAPDYTPINVGPEPEPKPDPDACPECNGTGEVDAGYETPYMLPCATCEGTGKASVGFILWARDLLGSATPSKSHSSESSKVWCEQFGKFWAESFEWLNKQK